MVNRFLLAVGLAAALLASGCSTSGGGFLKENFVDPFIPEGDGGSATRERPKKAPKPFTPARELPPITPAPTLSKPAPKPTPKSTPVVERPEPPREQPPKPFGERDTVAPIASNTKGAAAAVPYGVFEQYVRGISDREYTKLKRFGNPLPPSDRRSVVVNTIVEDLKLAVQKYAKLSGGPYRIEPVDFSTWEVNTFRDRRVNASVMPGGKITVFSEMFNVAEDDIDALAIVLGHEVSHELLKHARNRSIASVGVNAALMAAQKNTGLGDDPNSLRTLGTAVNVGGMLPWSRNNESDADHLGAILATIAGYDISKGAWLWKRMKRASGGQAPPEWLSTHPSPDGRVAFFENEAGEIKKRYAKYHSIPLSSL